MSEYIHQDDAHEWLRDKEIAFAEQDFAKVQAERDMWKQKFMHYARIAEEALQDLREQVGNEIKWTYLNDLYEMLEVLKND